MDGEKELNDEEQEVKVMAEPLRTLLFWNRMKILLPHHLSLNKRMKDCTISYVDLLRLDPFPPRLDEDQVP